MRLVRIKDIVQNNFLQNEVIRNTCCRVCFKIRRKNSSPSTNW